MKNKLFTSKIYYKNTFFNILGLFFLSYAIYEYFININRQSERFFAYIYSSILAGVIFILLRKIFFLKKIIFYETSMEIIDFFGFRRRKFTYKSINYWFSAEKEKNEELPKYFIVKFDNGEKIKFREENYVNFKEIFEMISSQKKENKAEGQRREASISFIFFILFFVTSFFFIYRFNESVPIDVQPQNLVEINVNLSEPVIKKKSYKGIFESYVFYTEEYPDFDFRINQKFSNDTLKDYLEMTNDVKIQILKSVYEAKILKNGSANFWQKYISPYEVEVVAIPNYFSSSDYAEVKNEYRKRQRKIYLFLSLVFIILGGISLHDYWYRKKHI